MRNSTFFLLNTIHLHGAIEKKYIVHLLSLHENQTTRYIMFLLISISQFCLLCRVMAALDEIDICCKMPSNRQNNNELKKSFEFCPSLKFVLAFVV